jgi:hypothetical protein
MWTLRVKTGVRPEEAYGMHFVNVLDTRFEKAGTKTWHQVDITKKEESEVVENFGGPCRGRTYGPLIKRCPVDQTQQIQEPVSEQKNKESE